MSTLTAPIAAIDLAQRFESLGGGSLNANGWAFGCEFGFWQQFAGADPIGLLRWSSIAPHDLKRGLEASFVGVDDPAALSVHEHTDWDWGIVQDTYGIRIDHTGLCRSKVTAGEASRRMAASLGFMRRKLIDDLTSAEKIFVYRTYDHTMADAEIEEIASLVHGFGGGTFCYVRCADSGHPPLTAVRRSDSLIVGYIDHFAPRDGRLDFNHSGWEGVCRAALDLNH